MGKKKPQHGGPREGSGRKPTSPEGKTMLVAATVPIVLVEQLDELRETKGWNRSQAVTEAIRGLLSKKV
jgi:hypothetical protein